MKKLFLRKRVVSVLLTFSFVFSYFVNVMPVFGLETEEVTTSNAVEELPFGISLATSDEVVNVEDAIYVSYNEGIKLDTSTCDWGKDVSMVTIVNIDEGLVATSDTPSIMELPKRVRNVNGVEVEERVDGTYIVDVLDKDGARHSIDLASFFGCSENIEVKHDMVGVNVSSVVFGTMELFDNNDTYYTDEDYCITISLEDNTPLSVIESISIDVNGNSIPRSNYLLDNNKNTISIEYLDLIDYLSPNNTLNIEITKELYKSSYSKEFNFNIDFSKLVISGLNLSNPTIEIDDALYVRSGTEVSVDSVGAIMDGVSVGVRDIRIENNGTYLDTAFPFKLQKEGTYKVVATTTYGKVISQELFGGKSIVFDDDSPKVDSVEYSYILDGDVQRSELDSNSWYNTNGNLKFIVQDAVGLSDEVYLTVNNITKELTAESLEVVDGIITKCGFAISTTEFTPDSNGIYNIYFNVVDLVGNDTEYTCTVNVDTEKPNYNDVTVEGFTVDSDKYYANTVTFDGSFVDYASGVKEVFFQKDTSSEFESISLPFSVDNDEGLFKVVDNAGNYIIYPVSELLNSLGYDGYVFDTTNPVINYIGAFPDYKHFVGDSLFYDTIPEFQYEIVEDNVKTVNFYINGSKTPQESQACKDSSMYYFTPSGIDIGRVNIRIEVIDKADNVGEYNHYFVFDNKAPENLKLKLGDVKVENIKGGNVYFLSKFEVSSTATDTTSFVKHFILKGIDANGNNIEVCDVDGNFTIDADGSYYVSAVDNVGNESEPVALGDALNWGDGKSNNVVIDTQDPTISVKSDKTYANGVWYSSNVKYSIFIEDDKGIDTADVIVNGAIVDSVNNKDSVDTLSSILNIDTSKLNVGPDGGYTVSVVVIDNSGRKVTKDLETFYVDTEAPRVVSFDIIGAVKELGSAGAYRYVFDGKGKVTINVSDTEVSSGIKSIYYAFNDGDFKEVVTNGDTYITVDVPEDFKGVIRAKVEDNVGHISDITASGSSSDGLVSEGVNTHLNNSSIEITFEDVVTYDKDGLPLYNRDFSGKVFAKCEWSGISLLEWGVDDDTLGSISDFSEASKWDGNLPLHFDSDVNMSGNLNAMTLWVRVVDNAGHISESSKQFSIDKDVPIVKVEYDVTYGGGFYTDGREATITVNERNFDTSKFNIKGSYGDLGSWKNDGNVWSNTISFNSDGDYDFSIEVVDMAGNVSDIYNSGSFTIDTIAPELHVSWDNEDNVNGYYSKTRTATVTVIERNFDSSLISIVGADVGSWVSNGNTHTVNIFFNNGEYSLSISGRDRANLKIEQGYNSGKFIIDTVLPKISIEGVSKGVSYKNDVGFIVSVEDAYLDSSTSVILVGKTHSEAVITGTITNTSATYIYDNFPKIAEIDDVYTISVYAKDKSGNTVSNEVTFSINRFGSSYVFDNESEIGNYSNSSSNVSITEMNVDSIDTSKVRIVVTLNGKEIKVPEGYISIKETEKNGKYYYTYEIDKNQFSKEGKYTIQIYSASDDGTEYTSVAEQYDFIVDKTSPDIVISGIDSGKIYKEYSKKVTVDVRDFSGVKYIEVILNGSPVDLSEENGLYSFMVYESEEVQSIIVNVVDNADNKSTVEINGFKLTTDTITYLESQNWFRLILIFVVVGVIAIMAIIVIRKMLSPKRKIRSTALNKVVSDDGTTDLLDNLVDNSETDIL